MIPAFSHKDADGDVLRVWGGDLGAVIYSADHNPGSDTNMVAVHFDKLPDLISTLQAILDADSATAPAECERCKNHDPRDRIDHGHLDFCGEGPHGDPCNRIVVNGSCPTHGPVGP